MLYCIFWEMWYDIDRTKLFFRHQNYFGGAFVDKIKWTANRMPKTEDAQLPVMGLD